ncbi:MAG: hypothetical protein IJ174_00935 [Clostridia bacterium]|nr:hypothetical protein [Clostridia bacterium]
MSENNKNENLENMEEKDLENVNGGNILDDIKEKIIKPLKDLVNPNPEPDRIHPFVPPIIAEDKKNEGLDQKDLENVSGGNILDDIKDIVVKPFKEIFNPDPTPIKPIIAEDEKNAEKKD